MGRREGESNILGVPLGYPTRRHLWKVWICWARVWRDRRVRRGGGSHRDGQSYFSQSGERLKVDGSLTEEQEQVAGRKKYVLGERDASEIYSAVVARRKKKGDVGRRWSKAGTAAPRKCGCAYTHQPPSQAPRQFMWRSDGVTRWVSVTSMLQPEREKFEQTKSAKRAIDFPL